MIIALFTTLVASCAAWLLGKQIMHWRRQAPLYNIPGPPSVSLLTGKRIVRFGILYSTESLFSREFGSGF